MEHRGGFAGGGGRGGRGGRSRPRGAFAGRSRPYPWPHHHPHHSLPISENVSGMSDGVIGPQSSFQLTSKSSRSRPRGSHHATRGSSSAPAKRDFSEVTIGYRELLELSEKDGTEILLRFTQQNLKFANTLRKSAEALKPDLIVLFMKCVSKVCEVAFDESKSSILGKISQSEFMATLERYFLDLPYVKINDKQSNSLFWYDCDDFWINVFKFYNCVISLMPSIALDTLPRLVDVNKLTIQGLRDHQKERFQDELLENFDDIQIRLVLLKEEAAAKLETRKASEEDTPVPDDFKSKPILPDISELRSKHSVFLRPNIIEGAYNSVEHYLDVQFRLMREDYISPMRDAIMSYIKDPTQRRYNGGRFYRNTVFKHLAISKKRVGVLVAFNQGQRRWNLKAFIKRFLFGSLLCFTKDDFNTCFFGTIVDRSENLLSQGTVIVDLENVELSDELFSETYIMFESDVFYLQYGPVLKALQSIGENLPMKNCIVNMQVSENLPSYIKERYVINDNFIVDLTMDEAWPTAETLGFDESQYNAYKMALTREFVTIQGPPGTGKTYIGLKIVETLLKNISEAEKPILVMCYTNHALDQFLSGILPTTENLVRIGGQSKNEALAKRYNLHSLRERHHNSHSRQLYDVIGQMEAAQNVIFNIDSDFCVVNCDVVLHYLKSIIKEFHSKIFKSHDHFREWLLMTDKPKEVLIYLKENLQECYQAVINTMTQDRIDDLIKLKDFENLLADEDDEDGCGIKTEQDNFSLFYMAKAIQKLDLLMSKCENERRYYMLENRKRLILCQLFFLKKQLTNERRIEVDFSDKDPYELNANQRWWMYWFWCGKLKRCMFQKLMELQKIYHGVFKLFESDNMMNDISTLKDADVIGLTTTAAARLRPLLCTLSPSIVVVEEAAEVLESHVVVNLNEHCKHVIMIGDHQQLRPMTASYRLGKHFNMDISLFERMFKNGKNFCQLSVQHRMRPDFASLITPSIYSTLHNHPSVSDYPDIKGVSKNMFFVSHQVPEEMDEELSSRTNIYEANFVIRLAKYLIQQGYEASEITMLSTYSGQMFYMRQLKRNMEALRDVKLCVLDNYQGEENKIILLTLVRSNLDNSIGFLSIANRVCVALSRAKEGFYIIGNMTNLTHESELWNKINTTLMSQNSIGLSIPLQCQNHHIITQVTTHDDFDKVAEGGCLNQCKVLLKCGHVCQRLCHVNLDDHEDYKCKDKCDKECEIGHKCRLLCFQSCLCSEMLQKLFKCGHTNTVMCNVNPDTARCFVEVTVTLPLCSHEVKATCYMPIDEIACSMECVDRLPCGHACTELCHKRKDPEHLEYECKIICGRPNKNCMQDHRCQKLCYQDCENCTIQVTKTRENCSHSQKVACHEDIDLVPCKKPCKRAMLCGHFCTNKCCEPCTGCLVKVAKERSCGHSIMVPCSQDPETVKCDKQCPRTLQCGHKCRNKCSEQCGLKACFEQVSNPYESLCGHDFKILCKDTKLDSFGSMLVMEFCKEPCGMILKDCEHICQGTCGKCRGRLHPPCSQACGNRLICGHICDDPCREFCSMCRKPCRVFCKHSKCPFFCGVPCKPCKHPCDRKCVHSTCTKECGELCNREPCSEPCKLVMKCGHKCLGLCGEQCLDICKICKPEEFPQVFFGDEDDEDAKFIKLLDCQHVVEVGGMDHWVDSKESGEIAYPRCPHCNMPIMNTPRYYKVIKTTFKDIQNAKRKIYGDPKEIKALVTKLNTEMQALQKPNIDLVFKNVSEWKSVVMKIKNNPTIKTLLKDMQDPKKWLKKTVAWSKVDVENYILQTAMLNRLANIFLKMNQMVESKHVEVQLKFLLRVLYECNRKMTQQQVDSFECELSRTNSMVRYQVADNYINSLQTGTALDKKELPRLNNLIFSNKLFDATTKTEVEQLFKSLSFKIDDINLERAMIVKAVGLKQGHWFKCPNGHPYCIGECGGAMEESKCPECGCKIGGTHHRLLDNNQLAPEMDRASHAAYSDFANEQMMVHRNFN
ncbi:NFX1-type zinc finger-containing protein 1-like [Arctopsyche grandis]|uniref:NFX1-type zinc finger-containing protein 1-like n=1 Tax=Arctopsyche grandis TaxID=121162 RepID=UPI00406D647D